MPMMIHSAELEALHGPLDGQSVVMTDRASRLVWRDPGGQWHVYAKRADDDGMVMVYVGPIPKP